MQSIIILNFQVYCYCGFLHTYIIVSILNVVCTKSSRYVERMEFPCSAKSSYRTWENFAVGKIDEFGE